MAEQRAPRTTPTWLLVAAYFVAFFGAMTLGGLLFTAGGIAIILIPGSLPVWVDVAYIAFGAVGSVTIAVLAANGAFRLAARRRDPDTVPAPASARAPRVLAWVAGIVGAVVASVLSTVLGTVILTWLDR